MASPKSVQDLFRVFPRREPDDLCACGHPRTAHEHLRRGTDCSLCPAGECPRFRRARRR